MTIRHAILPAAALALLLPVLTLEAPLRAQDSGANPIAAPERHQPNLGLDTIATPPLRVLEQARRPQVLGQVRIEQRVIIRISPSPPDARERMAALQQRRAAGATIREVPHDGCVRVNNILGVQPTNDNRLLLFMENRNVLAASLEPRCTAQAFYSGFYVERNEDGRLCINRDRLHSRAGTSCSLDSMTRLVASGG